MSNNRINVASDVQPETKPLHTKVKSNLEQATPDYSSTPTAITTAKTTQLSSYALSQAIDELPALSLSSSRTYVVLFVIF